MHKFKELDVYKKALTFTRTVRETTKRFPKDELFVLSSRFLDYSIRSGFECLGCLDIALENNYIDEAAHKSLAERANELIAMVCGLKNSLFRT